jgi:hypothetical protein
MEMENVGDLVPTKAHKSGVISKKETARLSQNHIFKKKYAGSTNG